MRARLALSIALAILMTAGAAWAADGVVAGVKPSVMRTVTAAPAKTAPVDKTTPGRKAAPLPLLAAAAPRLSSPIPTDPSQCRLSCAQSYYFCFESDEPDTCGGVWTSCLAACSRPPLTQQ